jgi:uncharacterized Fe-S cluster-containing radical SAM superfamily protein
MTSAQLDLSRHPCFNPLAKGSFGRVHLPVAPKCNIKCNYCNRKYDCVNESRPGVTSTVLTPAQAVEYVGRVLAREPRISVAGIAGPGDPFANGEETMDTLRLLRRGFPEIILCLASNGMNIGPCIPELGELKVSHVTVTVNAVDPEIGARIYGWVKDGKVAYRGREGAELLLARQLAAVRELKGHGITVKINSILIPGINDHISKTWRRGCGNWAPISSTAWPCFPTWTPPLPPFPSRTPPGWKKRGRRRKSTCRRCAIAPAAAPTPSACSTVTAAGNSGAACPPVPPCLLPARPGLTWRWPPGRAFW